MNPTAGPPPSILVIDDVPANLAVMVDSLEERGFRVLVAEDGAEGVRRAEFAAPDLILLDVNMPGIDGFETCRRLKAQAATRAIPVLFMTALGDLEGKLAAFAAGGVDYIVKPFELAEVLARVNTQLALRRLQATLEARNADLQREVAERRRAEAELREAFGRLERSEERYRLLVQLSPDAILIGQGGHVVFANYAAQRLYGARRSEDLPGVRLSDLVAPPDRAVAAEATSDPAPGGSTLEERALRLDGTEVAVAVTRLAFEYEGEPATQIVVRDVSEHKRLASELHHRATHDELTGLPNRTLLLDRLRQALRLAQRQRERLLVCFIDLDHFKAINDNLGHACGDELLQTVARLMTACLRNSDTLARLGGDEFVLLLPEPGEAPVAGPVIERVMAAVRQPLTIGERVVSVGCSVGCSRFPEDGQRAEDLLHLADLAMYEAKQAGRDRLRTYSDIGQAQRTGAKD